MITAIDDLKRLSLNTYSYQYACGKEIHLYIIAKYVNIHPKYYSNLALIQLAAVIEVNELAIVIACLLLSSHC